MISKLLLYLVGFTFTVAIVHAENSVSWQKLTHSVRNLETELAYLKQRIENQDATMEQLRLEVADLIKATKEHTTQSTDAFATKLTTVEHSFEKLIADMKQFKTYVNTLGEQLDIAKRQIGDETSIHKIQNKKLQDLEAAVHLLAKALQNSPFDKEHSYQVKAGDSLGKIAAEFGTTAKRLKECNNLSSDMIVPGQHLKLPES